MSEHRIIPAEYIYVTIPTDYLKVYLRILAALTNYGEEMLKDCKASCTDRNSGIIECFNMFNAAVAAKKLGDEKLAETLISYVDKTLSLKYKDIEIPTSISFPVVEEDAMVQLNFTEPPLFNVIFDDVIPMETIQIVGLENIEAIEYDFSYVYTPNTATRLDVTWEITSGSEYANIDSKTGKLYIYRNANNSDVVIKVTDANNPNLYSIKSIICTYNNEYTGEGEIIISSDTLLTYNNTDSSISVILSGFEESPSMIELYKVDKSNNNTTRLITKDVTSQTGYSFSIKVNSDCNYYVKGIFTNGEEVTSNILNIVGVDPCYIGFGKRNFDIVTEDFIIEPTLEIGSQTGKEYPVTCEKDGDYLIILVPNITGHMNIDEIRMDSTNLSDGFDMEYFLSDSQIYGIEYKRYEVNLNNKGFVADDYRILITS